MAEYTPFIIFTSTKNFLSKDTTNTTIILVEGLNGLHEIINLNFIIDNIIKKIIYVICYFDILIKYLL